MLPVVRTLLASVVSTCRSREALQLEKMALRHQVAVYQRMVHRPRLRPTDRLFWSRLSRLWTGWQEALACVQPRTIRVWHRQRFRDHWRCLSQRGKPGRPAIAKEVRELLAQVIVMSEQHLTRVLTPYVAYDHHFRTHLSLAMDCPYPRPVSPPERGRVMVVPEVGGRHHHDERQQAA